MAALDNLRDRWDAITPRERKLVVLLGITGVITILLFIGLDVSDRLDAMEARNAKTRRALAVLQDYRVRGRPDASDNVAVNIGTEPVKLESYLDKAAQKVGISVPAYKPRLGGTRNGFQVHTVEIQVNGLTIEQVRDFLEAIEADNKLVVTSHIVLKHSFSDKEKLDLKLEVNTYSKLAAAPAAGGGSGAPGGASGTGSGTPGGG
ncbi:MAG: type II secretion system protein M [Kofleriaceae bacterium]|nr:type II secretion system protein M [Myxococcales bacterium]MCB9560963.1 type II secretion system protein M [Kofleriaceae bacterium]MCB9575003.1 type II secretion system protein M [Kofleriaceae bacterium]